jgi:hypothetical protein
MDIDTKRKRLDLSRVRLAREELELKIEERMEEIGRLRAHIEIQNKKEEELTKELEQGN